LAREESGESHQRERCEDVVVDRAPPDDEQHEAVDRDCLAQSQGYDGGGQEAPDQRMRRIRKSRSLEDADDPEACERSAAGQEATVEAGAPVRERLTDAR